MADDLEKRLKKLQALMHEQEQQIAACHDTLRQMAAILAGGDPLLDLERFWLDTWRAKYGAEYVWSHAKDRASIRRLLKTLAPDTIKARVIAFLASEEPFFTRNRHSFGVFVSAINSLTSAEPRQVVLGCKHDPPCASDVEHTRRRAAEMVAPDQPF